MSKSGLVTSVDTNNYEFLDSLVNERILDI